LDHTVWSVSPEVIERDGDLPPEIVLDGQGQVVITPFDVDGYLASIERCRARFPQLRVLSGLEVGEPHRHADAVSAVLAAGTFDRVLGSLHCLPEGDRFFEPYDLGVRYGADPVLRAYLAEVAELVSASDAFAVLAHIDYPLRYWSGD